MSRTLPSFYDLNVSDLFLVPATSLFLGDLCKPISPSAIVVPSMYLVVDRRPRRHEVVEVAVDAPMHGILIVEAVDSPGTTNIVCADEVIINQKYNILGKKGR